MDFIWELTGSSASVKIGWFFRTRALPKTVGGFAPLLVFPQGVQKLFHPLSFCGKGVARMTFTELCQFCTVLIGLAGLIIEIMNNKKK